MVHVQNIIQVPPQTKASGAKIQCSLDAACVILCLYVVIHSAADGQNNGPISTLVCLSCGKLHNTSFESLACSRDKAAA